jgi:hypothetical protein
MSGVPPLPVVLVVVRQPECWQKVAQARFPASVLG